MHVTKLVVEPMLSFITKVTAVKVAQQGADAAKPLREQVRLVMSMCFMPKPMVHYIAVQTSTTYGQQPSTAYRVAQKGAEGAQPLTVVGLASTTMRRIAQLLEV